MMIEMEIRLSRLIIEILAVHVISLKLVVQLEE